MANPTLLRIAFWAGTIGFVASLLVHLASFTDLAVPGAAMALHFGVFAALLPVAFALKGWAEREGFRLDGFRGQWALQKGLLGLLSPWQKGALALLLVYTLVNFTSEATAVEGDPSGGFGYRLFSGHWMFFYFVSAAYAGRFLALQRAVEDKEEVGGRLAA